MFAKNGPTLFALIQQSLVSTRRGYDMLAPNFDLTPFRTPDEVLRPAIAGVGPVRAALDVCCGTGVALQFLRPLCSERLVGIDFSSGMIAEARRKLDSSPRPPVLELMESDALGMSFCEEFDAVTCFGALGHILPADQRLFVRRIRDALRPGGRFVFVTGPPPPLFSPVSIVLRSFNAVMKLRNLLLRPPFVMYYLTFLLPQARRLLEEEGFAVTVQHGALAAPYQRYAIVVATRL